ncbi:MAG: type IV toxin-antitoxin system AbiEi family antitoxin domain-containing protein [Pseudobdellovibrionaceae bacterium]
MKNDILYLQKLKAPEVTTGMLLGVLSDYKSPQKKINNLHNKGLISLVKQGVYLISSDLGLRPYSKDILANLIYGPSYISMTTALSNYGFIPERVNTITSVCFGRGKSFSTPVGEFEFHHIKKNLYPLGVQLKEVFKGAFCHYATPEKALLDFIYFKETKGEFKNQKDYLNYILEAHRLDVNAIKSQVSRKRLQTYSEQYPFQHVQWFSDELTRKLVK